MSRERSPQSGFGTEAFPPRWCWVWLVLLLGAGLFTRGWHLSMEFTHPDEPIATGVSRSLDTTWDTNWRLADLPPEHKYDQYNFSGYLYAAHGWAKLAGPWLPATWAEERDGVVLLRSFSVLCGALAVVWIFLLGERLGGWVTGAGAALLVLVNPQLVADGHYARPEAMLTWLTLVVVWLALKEEWGWRWRLAVSALLAGFLIATKVTMGLMLVAPVWIAWQGACEFVGVQRFWRFDLALLAAGLLILVGFAAGAPGAVAQPNAFLHGVRFLAEQYGGFHEPHSEFDHSRIAWAQLKFYQHTVGVGGFALWAVAAVYGWRRRQWPTLVLVMAPFAGFAGYFATKMVFFERNLSHVLPLALVGVAVGAVLLAGWLARESVWQRGWTLLLLLALTAAPGAAISAQLLTAAFSGEVQQAYHTHQQATKERYAMVEWRPISLLFTRDLEKLRKDFAREHAPVLVQYADFNDSYSRHYGAILEREFVSTDVGRFEKPLSAVPCSALNVYHGHRVVYKIITGRRPPGLTAR